MPQPRCRLCGANELEAEDERSEGVCHACQGAQGYWRLPAWNRPIRPCAGCGSREFIRALAMERGARGADYVHAYAAPMAVAFRRIGQRGLLGSMKVGVPETQVAEQISGLEMLICRACGLTTWYALDPAHIPIGPEFGTEILRVPDSDPYR